MTRANGERYVIFDPISSGKESPLDGEIYGALNLPLSVEENRLKKAAKPLLINCVFLLFSGGKRTRFLRSQYLLSGGEATVEEFLQALSPSV